MGEHQDCILLVEDDERTLAAMARLFQLDGYAVVTARTAAEGLAAGSANRCGVVVCDLRLPDGDGADLVRGLKAVYATKAVCVTGMSDFDPARPAATGFDRHLTKPVVFTDLLEAVRELAAPGGIT